MARDWRIEKGAHCEKRMFGNGRQYKQPTCRLPARVIVGGVYFCHVHEKDAVEKERSRALAVRRSSERGRDA